MIADAPADVVAVAVLAEVLDEAPVQGAIQDEVAVRAETLDGVAVQGATLDEAPVQGAIPVAVVARAETLGEVEVVALVLMLASVAVPVEFQVAAAEQDVFPAWVGLAASPVEVAPGESPAVPDLAFHWRDVRYSVPVGWCLQDARQSPVFRRSRDVYSSPAWHHLPVVWRQPDENPADAPRESCDRH